MPADLTLASIAGVLACVLAVRVIRRRRRVAPSPRRTQFGLSAVDLGVADQGRAAWEIAPPRTLPRGSRTSIGYAVVPARVALEDPATTTFDPDLSSYVERHHRAHGRLARGSYPPVDAPLPERSLRTSGLAEDRPTVSMHAVKPPR